MRGVNKSDGSKSFAHVSERKAYAVRQWMDLNYYDRTYDCVAFKLIIACNKNSCSASELYFFLSRNCSLVAVAAAAEQSHEKGDEDMTLDLVVAPCYVPGI